MTKFTLSAIIMLLSLVPIGVDAQNATAKYMHISDRFVSARWRRDNYRQQG